MPNPIIDETGNRYGSLTVIKYEKDKNGRGAWLCQCDCGNTKVVRGPDLRKNRVTHCSKSCPCKTSSNFIDETGNIYGFLTVLYKTPFKSNSNKTLWHCKCECGNEIDVLGESLRNNLTKSCGCKSKELNSDSHSLDLKGFVFGYLEPIELIEKANGNSRGNKWRCKCNCGCNRDDIIVPTHDLTSNNTQSCGRLKQSHGENDIEIFLKKHNLDFQKQYTFDDLYGDKNKLKFDFCVFDDNKQIICLIEFDGEQHFHPIEYFGGEEKFQQQIKYDNLKNIYCLNNNIKLLRIKYNDNIEQKLKEYFNFSNIENKDFNFDDLIIEEDEKLEFN